jgi:hypothetical protein
MRGRSSLFWAVVAVILIGLVVYAPALLARASTAPDEPVDFLTHPQDGWRFVIDVVSDKGSAKAGTPQAARDLAVRHFSGSPVLPVRVDLLYLPSRRFRVGGKQGTITLPANSQLLWKVTGRTSSNGPLRTVALIEYSTGAFVYDVRRA